MKVFEQWQSYEREVLPVNAPEIQRQECRIAFYAGAWALYWLVLDAVEAEDEGDCERNLEALADELKEVTRDMQLEAFRGATRRGGL